MFDLGRGSAGVGVWGREGEGGGGGLYLVNNPKLYINYGYYIPVSFVILNGSRLDTTVSKCIATKMICSEA